MVAVRSKPAVANSLTVAEAAAPGALVSVTLRSLTAALVLPTTEWISSMLTTS